jgi:hypothetical protein
VSAAGFLETTDRRVLGGFVFVDAITRETVLAPLAVTSRTLRVRANRSGVYAIFDAPGSSRLTTQFNPPAAGWPAGQSFEVTVRDPNLRYLARRANVQAPQGLTAVLTPQQVNLYAGPSAVLAPNWAVIRVSVTGSAGKGLPWAALHVIRSDNSVAAAGVTDARGEAVLAVTGLGVQVSADASGAVTETTIPVTVQAWFDPSVLVQPPGWIPNPDDMLGNLSNASLKSGTQTGALGAGHILYAAITIAA